MKTRHLFTGMGRSTPSPVAKKIYREEDKGRNAFFRFLAASPLRLACCLVLIGLLAGCGRQPVSSGRQASVETSLPTRAAPTPTAVEQVTHTPTASPTATPSPRPTRTSTPTQTATPSPTRTPTATASATPSPSPSPTQTQTPTPAPPTPTPSPTTPPTPSLDFRVLSYRLWPLDLNSGCAKGMHTIFIVVLDANGAPLDGVVVGDSWNNVEEVSGRKGPGRTEINLWANAMEIMVKRDAASGQAYSSEIGPMFGSFLTDIPNEQLAQAGYCANEAHCQWMRENDGYHCGGHYSWEVIFQKQAP